MLAWPFPLARAMLPPLVNVASVLVFWQLVQVVYFAVTVAFWGRTGGMRLQGLNLSARAGGPPSRASRIRWALIAGAFALAQVAKPATAPRSPLAERTTGIALVAE